MKIAAPTINSASVNCISVPYINMHYAILQEISGRRLFVQMKGKAKVGKQWVRLTPALEFNKLYKAVEGEAVPAESSIASYEVELEGSNKEYYDDNTAQKLTQEEINELKQTKTGEEVIQHLVENSSTFNKKTQFSQEKYLKKKKQKYLGLFRLLRPTSANIADCAFMNDKRKSLRSDALGCLIYMSNLYYGSKVCVVDQVSGILLGAVLERTSDVVTQVKVDRDEPKLMKYYSFNREIHQRIDIKSLETLTGEFDCFIAAVRILSTENMQKMLSFMAPSSSFAIHSQDINTLGCLQEFLISNTLAVNVSLEEVWTRELQILPERTHPLLRGSVSGYGGFILSGVKVVSN